MEGFGRCLLHAIQQLFAAGHTAACVLSSDTPTLPTDILVSAATALLAGDERRVVMGACDDGGYYLLGMRLPHAGLFADIAWSSSSVAATTRTRIAELGLDLVELPLWYDIDDAAALERLVRDNDGYAAPWTRRALRTLGPGYVHAFALRRMKNRPLLCLLVGFGGALLALTVCGLLLDIPASTGGPRITRMNELAGLLVVSAAVYFGAVRLILRNAWPRGTVWIVLGVAVALRMLLLTVPPTLSSDIYRYVWDGRVQANGINPYRYIPADPALASLRDAVIYPQINRADYARTIYPPFAQMAFAAVGRIWDSVMGMRLAMLGFEALGIICLLRLLPLVGLPPERILIYAWNPLALWSFANDGHVDAIAIGLLGLALLLRARRKDGWAGTALAGAVLVKLFPLVVAPAFLRGGRFWQPALAGFALIAGCYALYSGAGWHVFGFLRWAGEEEGWTAERDSGCWPVSAR